MDEKMKAMMMTMVKEGRIKITIDLKEDELNFFLKIIKRALELPKEKQENEEKEKPTILAGTFT